MSELREKAMDYLARREHGRAELKQKLLLKNFSAQAIDNELDRLTQENLQSDDRFAQSYVRYRRQQGFGPKRIAVELRLKGIHEQVIADYVDEKSSEWKKQMIAVWQKKFSTAQNRQKSQSQQFRFLYQRGFASEMIQDYLNVK